MVGSPSILNVVSVSDADDSIPMKETSQTKGAKGVVTLTKVHVGTSSQSESENGVLHSIPVQGEGLENAATINEDLTNVVIASDQ